MRKNEYQQKNVRQIMSSSFEINKYHVTDDGEKVN